MRGIRAFRPTDRAAVYRICVATGDNGADATGQYPDDDLIPDVFAGPYLEFEPELAFVVQTDAGVAGYVIAAADTRRFVTRYREEWLPAFAKKYSPEADAAHIDAADGGMIKLGIRPERMLIAEVDEYPAHLHIDLLPELQGQGWGSALMRTLFAALAERGIRNVHLTLSPTNPGARAFYDRLGFHELPSSTPNGPVLGISTSVAV